MVGLWWRELWRMMRVGAFWGVAVLYLILLVALNVAENVLSALAPRVDWFFSLTGWLGNLAIQAWFVTAIARGVAIALSRSDRRVSFSEMHQDLLMPWLRVGVFNFLLQLITIAVVAILLFVGLITVGISFDALLTNPDAAATQLEQMLGGFILLSLCIGIPLSWLIGLLIIVIQTGLAVEYPASMGEALSRLGRVLRRGFGSLLAIWATNTGFVILVMILISCAAFVPIAGLVTTIDDPDAGLAAGLGVVMLGLCLFLPFLLVMTVYTAVSTSTMYVVVRNALAGGRPYPTETHPAPPMGGPRPRVAGYDVPTPVRPSSPPPAGQPPVAPPPSGASSSIIPPALDDDELTGGSSRVEP